MRLLTKFWKKPASSQPEDTQSEDAVVDFCACGGCFRCTDCPICLQRYDASTAEVDFDVGMLQPCGHVFHGACLHRWVSFNPFERDWSVDRPLATQLDDSDDSGEDRVDDPSGPSDPPNRRLCCPTCRTEIENYRAVDRSRNVCEMTECVKIRTNSHFTVYRLGHIAGRIMCIERTETTMYSPRTETILGDAVERRRIASVLRDHATPSSSRVE